MRRILLVAAAALISLTASRASAATDTADLTVNATVSTVCSVAAATLNFPDYNPVTGAAVDGSANVSVTCTKGTPFKLVLDSDAGEMKPASGPSRLAYTLHSDASRTTAFPTAVAAQSNVTATGTAPDSVAIFGRVTASQNTVEAGLHSDTVAMTVHY